MKKANKPEKNKKKQKHFWKDFKAELKKVNWPTRSQIVNNTVIVLIIVAIVSAICFVLDLAFEALNTYGIDKLKSAVQNSVSSTVEDEEEDSTSEDSPSEDSTDTNSADSSEDATEEDENTAEQITDIEDGDSQE